MPVVSDRRFYVYVLFRPWDGSPCYVGKGTGRRRSLHDWFGDRHPNPHLRSIIKRAKRDLPCVVRENMVEEDAFVLEMLLIRVIGRQVRGGPLANMTDGGEGVSGIVKAPEVLAREAASRSGIKRSLETRLRMSAAQRGHAVSDEARAKMSAAHVGRAYDPVKIEKMRLVNLGKPCAEATRAKISAARQYRGPLRVVEVDGRKR